MRLLWARGSAELRKVASGFVTQGLWLKNRKVESQVSGIDRSRLPGRGKVGEVRRGENDKEKPATERRRKYTDLGLHWNEREEQVACHASALVLAMTDEARRKAEMYTGRSSSLL